MVQTRVRTAPWILTGGLIWLAGQLACMCPNQECWTQREEFAECVYPNSPQENTNKRYIVLGPSMAAGGWCHKKDGVLKCGFIQKLEELTGEEIANFSLAALTAKGLVEDGYGRLNESVSNNPGAQRVYVMAGGVEIIHFFFDHPEEAPRPSTGCQLDPLESLLSETIANLRLLVLQYKQLGVQEVIVSSFPPVEESAGHALSCKAAILTKGADPDWRLHECLNEGLEYYAFLIQAMVQDLGGTGAGIRFADPFHAFPIDPSECSLFCDCGHPNCEGHDLIAEALYAAAP